MNLSVSRGRARSTSPQQPLISIHRRQEKGTRRVPETLPKRTMRAGRMVTVAAVAILAALGLMRYVAAIAHLCLLRFPIGRSKALLVND